MRRTVVFVVLLLALGLFPKTLFGQGTNEPERRPRVQLRQNYPNPFNPTTTIPFRLYAEDLVDGKAVVSIRIFNALHQLVAVPRALNHAAGDAPVERLEYTQDGDFLTYWDGTDKNGRKVASAVYYAQLEVNGERRGTMKMVVQK